VTNDEGDPFPEFCRRLFANVARLPVERFGLDIRLNNGGDNTLYLPLLHGLISGQDQSTRAAVHRDRASHFFGGGQSGR
jgi:hypothetical protein